MDLSKQLITVTLYDNDTHEIYLIGSDFVSSGDINKESETKAGEDHFLQTPTGIFENLKGWRSDGKYNEDKSVLAYGQKEDLFSILENKNPYDTTVLMLLKINWKIKKIGNSLPTI